MNPAAFAGVTDAWPRRRGTLRRREDAVSTDETTDARAEANRALARRFWEELANLKNLAAVDELVAPDFVHHGAADTAQARGPEGVRRWLARLQAALPDLRVTIDDVIAEGDTVVVRSTRTGTHLGPLFGLAPTGRRATWTAIDVFRVEGGQIAERWDEFDALGLLRLLGAAPGSR